MPDYWDLEDFVRETNGTKDSRRFDHGEDHGPALMKNDAHNRMQRMPSN